MGRSEKIQPKTETTNTKGKKGRHVIQKRVTILVDKKPVVVCQKWLNGEKLSEKPDRFARK